MKQGILYLATGDRRFLKATIVSARSAKRAMPDVHITLVSDAPWSGESASPPFDDLRLVSPPRSALEFFRLRIEALSDSPYDLTLHLDGDTYIVRDVRELFGLLDRFDIAAAHDTHRISVQIDDLPESFPEFNAGVIAYRTRALVAIRNRWLELYDGLGESETGAYDQPSLRQALWESDLRIGTLPSEFNCRFMHAGSYNMPVAILHERAPEELFERAARVMRAVDPAFWSTYVHYDWQVWGPHGSARRLLDLRDPVRKLRLGRGVLRLLGQDAGMPYPRE
jgi:hypothetical protein